MYCELFPLLNEEIVVLTPNHRLSNYLLQQFDQYQMSKQQTAWQTPNIFPLNIWLTQSWQHQPSANGLLLSDFQEQTLWQKIIRGSTYGDFVLHIPSTAKLAQQAWQSLQRWDLSLETMHEPFNEEIQAFITWSQQFEQRKQANEWLSQTELPKQCTELIRQGHIHLPKKIIRVGFDEIPPILQQLFDQIKAQTEIIEFIPTQQPTHSLQAIELATQDEELFTMARWAKQCAQACPSQRIACIIPELSQLRQSVHRIFTEIFLPHCILPGNEITTTPFNISAGQKLQTFPIIQTALNALGLHQHSIPLETLSTLLRSPYLNSHLDDASMAATVETHIRRWNQSQINPAALLPLMTTLATDFPTATLPLRWKKCFQKECSENKQLPSEWAHHFHAKLANIGWPTQRRLESEEYQLVQRWQKLLEEFCQLDSVTGKLKQHQALTLLRQLTSETIFQPESPRVSVQILGVLEASGQAFDQLWMMGLDDEKWPPSAKPNPFLPITLQRSEKMPHASAERELHYASQLQQRLLNSASHVILSSAKQRGDKPLTPSQLIHDIPSITPDALNLAAYKSDVERVFESQAQEKLEDILAPPVQPNETIRGGSRILQQQALCPFRAFTNIRLKATSLHEPSLGLNAAERGILVHEALEAVWKKIKTQENLLAYSESQCQQLSESIVNDIISYRSFPSESTPFLSIEKKRLVQLIIEWLALEKKRPNFKVSQRETTRHVKIGALPLTLQIDRIDTLDDGTQLVIDYKTRSQNNIYDWFSDRPLDCQLPLYCVYGTACASSLAYAQVVNGRMQFNGLMENGPNNDKYFSKVIPLKQLNGLDITPDWQSILKQWREVLEQLSGDFCTGRAAVDPVDPAKACLYCDLQSVCRIGSTS